MIEARCEFECLGGTTWTKISDTCVSPDVCAAPTVAGYFGQVVEVRCDGGPIG